MWIPHGCIKMYQSPEIKWPMFGWMDGWMGLGLDWIGHWTGLDGLVGHHVKHTRHFLPCSRVIQGHHTIQLDPWLGPGNIH